jgi:hypothetical protein
MGLFRQLLGRTPNHSASETSAVTRRASADASPPIPETPRHVLVHSASFASSDAKVVQAVRKALDNHLPQVEGSYLQTFSDLLTAKHSQNDVDRVRELLEGLSAQLATWPVEVTDYHHELFRNGVAVGWGLAEDAADPLDTFFETYVNASHYDAIILEQVIHVAARTFDAALEVSWQAFPLIEAEERRALAEIWSPVHLRMLGRWQLLHQHRFHAILADLDAHQQTDVAVDALFEFFRSFFETWSSQMVRKFRFTMLPVLTTVYSSRGAQRDQDETYGELLESVTTLGFTDGETAQGLYRQEKSLAIGYLLAWFNAWKDREELKKRSIEAGNVQLADEIQFAGVEQFTNYGEAAIDTAWQPIFDEVQSFFAAHSLEHKR